MQQRNVVVILAKSGGSVLFVKNNRGYYELPSVEVGLGDNPQEVAESEVNRIFDSKDVCNIRVCDVVSEDDASKGLQTIVIVYTSRIADGQPKSQAGEWIELSKKQSYKIDNLSENLVLRQAKYDRTDSMMKSEVSSGVNITTCDQVIISTDGGSRGNPGPSACGFIIISPDGDLLYEGGEYLGITTNNQAEYQAVKLALQKALELGVRFVEFKIDSLLIVNQMAGVYQIKNRDLWPIYTNIKDLIGRFKKVTFKHIPRELNKEADAIVNKILDERQ